MIALLQNEENKEKKEDSTFLNIFVYSQFHSIIII